MAKAAEAFRTISEVAEELDLQKHVLRFWEVKFPQIKPMKRGGGRRYYRPTDLDLLRGIRHLLHAEGYTIKGVQRILRERGIDTVKRIGSEMAETGTATSARSLGGPTPADADDSEAHIAPTVSRRAEPRAKHRAQGAEPIATRGAVRGASASDLRARLLAAIGELETCRAVLSGAQQGAAAPVPASRGVKSRAAG